MIPKSLLKQNAEPTSNGPAIPPNLAKQNAPNTYGPTIPDQLPLKKSVYGPMPANIPQSPPKLINELPKIDPKPTKREDWMMVPPEANRLAKDVKSRGFRKTATPIVDNTILTKLPGESTTSSKLEVDDSASTKDIEYRKIADQHNVALLIVKTSSKATH